MASRSSNSGGDCLGVGIALFILVFLPAWVTGDSFGWGVLIVWWIILAIIGFCIDAANSPSNNNVSTSTEQRTRANSNAQPSTFQRGNTTTASGLLKVMPNQLNKSIMDGYSSKIQLRVKLKNSVERLKQDQQHIDEKIAEAKKNTG